MKEKKKTIHFILIKLVRPIRCCALVLIFKGGAKELETILCTMNVICLIHLAHLHSPGSFSNWQRSKISNVGEEMGNSMYSGVKSSYFNEFILIMIQASRFSL